jgi:hypothetical protein
MKRWHTTLFLASIPVVAVPPTLRRGPAWRMTLSSSYNPTFVTAAGSLPLAEAALFDGIVSGRAYRNIHSTPGFVLIRDDA